MDDGLRKENSNLSHWHQTRRPEDLRGEMERPDRRTAERTMCPEVPRDDSITQLTPIMRRRGMWDENEVYPPRSYTRSHALEEGYPENVDLNPPQRHEIDQGWSPDLFDSPPRHDSAYHTAVTDRISARRTSGRPREQRSKSRSKRTKSEREDEADAKASSTRHPPSSHRRRSTQKKERKLLVFATSDSESETSGHHRSKSRSSLRERNTQTETRRTPIYDSSSDSSSSSDEDERTSTLSRPKHYLKPPKFDGLASFETFWAQFKNCAEHNKWDRVQRLVYLRSSLAKEVANVLWDYGKEVTNSLSGLTRILKMRFGGKSFADKHRIEIRNKGRGPNATLQSLHIEIRHLAALAFPTMEHRTREVISCDYFLDALADPDFVLKIRERHPEDLDSALRIALQLEV